MLIVSDWRDYYDNIRVFGVDKTVVYQRDEKAILDRELKEIQSSYKTRLFDGATPQPIGRRKLRHPTQCLRIIGFCGNIFPSVYINGTNWDSELQATVGKEYTCYSFEAVKQALDELGIEMKKEKDTDIFFNSNNEYCVKKYFNSDYSKLMPFFQRYSVPSFLVGHLPILGSNNLLLNPCLKNFDFITVKDPPTAFQEIYAYISGVLGVQSKETVTVSDKDMQVSKGFDGQYSFKKPPGKRGKKQWR